MRAGQTRQAFVATTLLEEPGFQAERFLLIDIVKGLAIVLVALGHTNQGEISRGWWGNSALGVHLNVFLYSFHMPAFFFVSGILLHRSVAKRGLRGFVVQKARTLLYPFFLWSVIMPLAAAMLARVLPMRPIDLHAVLLNLVTGNTAWFLPSLFLSLALGAALRRVPPVPLFLVSYLAASFWPPTHILMIDRGMQYLPFVVAGMGLRDFLPRLQNISARRSLTLAAALAITLYLAVVHVSNQRLMCFGLLPAGFWGTGMLLLLGRSMTETLHGRVVARVGIASLGIFLLSPFPQGGMRLVLLAAHCKDPLVQLLLPTLAAVALPAWLYRRRDHFHLAWLFAWPSHQGLTTAPSLMVRDVR